MNSSPRKRRTNVSSRPSANLGRPETLRSLTEKNEELEMMLHITCHDLRSPLVNIQGFSRELTRACHRIRALLNDTPGRSVPKDRLKALLEEETAEAVGFIQSGLATMERLLDEVLRFSQLGRMVPNVQTLDMDALLQRIVRGLQYQIQQTRAQVTLARLPACEGDEMQIGQVFTNLLDNALKYLKPGRPGRISVTGEVRAKDAVYCVRDNGIGIAREDQARIFELFRRLHPAQGSGAGLGLAITRRVLERQQGRIWVESQPHRGSAFYLSLPMATPAKPGRAAPPQQIR